MLFSLYFRNQQSGTFLVAQGLRLHTPLVQGTTFHMPELKIPSVVRPSTTK